jgi:ketosteroid isomerase-like protein
VGAAENKQLMQDIFAEMAKGNGKLFVDSMADDFRWTIAGATKWSRTYEGKQAVIAKLLSRFFHSLRTRTRLLQVASSRKTTT